MMGYGQPFLFLDLHGVLVETPKVLDEYKRLTVAHLISHFDISKKAATKRYDVAMKKWEDDAFSYLRNPKKKKIGKPFLEFLEWCDALFPKYLYKGLDISSNCSHLRERPYEYKISHKIQALYPEVETTLQRLQDHGYLMYVASSSHSSHIRGIVEANGLDKYIQDFFGFDQIAATKHTTKYYRDLVDLAGAEPELSIMVGNSMHEILKPRKLGMHTIHVNRERKVPQEVRRLASRSINDLISLPVHLDQLQIIV